MKNLKKVLALAMVFALSMTLFAGAAFTDEADIGDDYKDDVNMLVQLKVIGGYPDGSFKPQGNITRAEFTKMAYTLKYGYDDAGKLFAGQASKFTDVEGNADVTWAKGYINYCATQNIIGGVGNNRFNPNGNVTVAEASKMLLVILGCDPVKETFGGSNWSGNVVSKAMELGVFDGWVGDPTEAATRELVAKLMRNTIFAPTYVYNPITGIGSQVSALDPTQKNETLGEKTMGLKHVSGLVVSNERYALSTDEEGEALEATAAPQPKDKSQIYYEYTNTRNNTTLYGKTLLTIDRDLSDDLLGSLVDVYFTADGQEGAYTNVEVIGDVIINAKTKAYDVMAASIKIMPDGDSSSSRPIKPYILFTTEEGEEKRVDVLTDDNNIRIPMNEVYNGAAFASRMYYSDVKPNSTTGASDLIKPEFEKATADNGYNPTLVSGNLAKDMVNQMGKNYMEKYRFVSVDGGETYSYILRLTNMKYSKIGSYNETAGTISVSGGGGTRDIADEVVLHYDNVQRGDKVVIYMMDDKLHIEPTETIKGKATSFKNNTATINGETYRSDLTSMGNKELGQFFTANENSGKNNENTEYTVFKGYVLEIDATAVTGNASDYAVVLYSTYDSALGTAKAKFGFANNTEGVYEISKCYGSESQSQEEMKDFVNNGKLGALYRVKIVNGMADLSAAAGSVVSDKGGISNGRFTHSDTTYISDSSSLVFLLYGGKKVGTADTDISAIKSKVYNLDDLQDTNMGTMYVLQEGSLAPKTVASAVENTGLDSIKTLLVGSLSIGTELTGIVAKTENIAYLLKAEKNYNVNTSKWYLDVEMITENGLVSTRTIDEVPDDMGNTNTHFGGSPEIGDEAMERGTLVVYKMTASQEEGDTNEWIASIGDNNGLGSIEKMSTALDTNASYNDGYYYVTIAAVRNNLIGFYPYGWSHDGESSLPAASSTIETDKNDYKVIAIDNDEFVEGGDIETVGDGDYVRETDKNAILVVEGQKVTRVFSLHNAY